MAAHLSIIIPTFNSAKTLKRCLDSIVAQSYKDWEVLVMDGASIDATLEIARSYNDVRIKVFSESDEGIYDAMNKGIEKSIGRWLYFLGSDDYLIDDQVLNQVFSMKIEDCDVIYGDVEADNLDENYHGEWTIDKIEFNRCHQALLYSKKVFSMVGVYDTRYKIMADFVLNLKCFFDEEIRMQHIDVVIAHYSDGGISYFQRDLLFEKDMPQMILSLGYRKLSNSQRIMYAKLNGVNNPTLRNVIFMGFIINMNRLERLIGLTRRNNA